MIEIREERARSTDAIVIRCAESGVAAGIERCVGLALRLGQVQLVLDLGERESADADLLSALHRSGRRVRDAGGRFAVVCSDAGLRRLFDMTLLSQGFLVYEALEDALAD